MKVGDVLKEILKKLKRTAFVRRVTAHNLCIEEIKNKGKQGTLQKLHITDIPFDTKDIWLLDELEDTEGFLVLKKHKTP